MIEMLFVLLFFSTVLTMMVPSMVSSQQKMRIDAAVQQLTIDLARARSEAVNRNQAVTVTRTGEATYAIPGVGARELDGKVMFDTGSATTITFASYGTLTPAASRTLTLRLGSQTRTVAVSSAGFARVR
jgi:Tfp pilus assembly protein FimT